MVPEKEITIDLDIVLVIYLFFTVGRSLNCALLKVNLRTSFFFLLNC